MLYLPDFQFLKLQQKFLNISIICVSKSPKPDQEANLLASENRDFLERHIFLKGTL